MIEKTPDRFPFALGNSPLPGVALQGQSPSHAFVVAETATRENFALLFASKPNEGQQKVAIPHQDRPVLPTPVVPRE
jgi:hypothetical protein